ncbi:hypothetical protein [Curtobacterium sp. SORGH_AS_0776]|uniref:hypothetical protein n=1 Tax=Curtobacterium sp. SORGH_AS_0776 TaxID=3041798 RepID=UPI00286545CB|nr:hypothetical protein [Curtobacterium sp. SORGH_AS_0776]MDR6170373.1 hypothetical protein [Curtobacterium sp. SORGH_AS_0776]
MDIGRAVIGASAIGAVVLAVGLGVATAPGNTLRSEPGWGAACGSYPDGAPTAAAWFMVEFSNESGRSIRVRDVTISDVEDAEVSHLAVVPHPGTASSGLFVTDDPEVPREWGRTVPLGDGVTVPPHGTLDFGGRMVVRDGASAGHIRRFTATTTGPLWTTSTRTLDQSFTIGVDDENAGAAIGCGPRFGDDT